MNIQIPIIGQQTRAGSVPQDYQSPILVDDARGAALQSFGQSLGDLAGGVAAWKKRQAATTVKTTEQQAGPGGPEGPTGPLSSSPTNESSGNPPPAAATPAASTGPPLPPEMGEPPPAPTYTPAHPNAVARQDYEIAKSNACLAVPGLRNTAERLFTDARQNLGPAQSGLVLEVLGKYDAAVEQALPSCTTPESRLYLIEYAKQGRRQLARQALASEAQAGIEERATRYQASAQAWAQVVAGDPGQIATALTALHHGMPDLDPGQREAARDNARTTLIHAGIMAEIGRNPRRAYATIVDAGGREDGAPGDPQAQDSGALATLTRIMTPAEREHYAPLAQAALYEQQAKQFEAFKTRQADTDAAYMATGTAQNPPTEPEFIAHYGDEEGRRLFGQQRITARAGQVRQFVKTLPAHALVDLREQADPATSEGAAVHHVIGEVEKARRVDPIAYALQNGSYGLSPITSFDDPQALKNELGKRRRAAAAIGADYQATPTVLSREEGKLLARSLQGKPVDEQKALLLQLTDGIGDPETAQSALRVLSSADPLAALAGQHQAKEALESQEQDASPQFWGGSGKLDAPSLILQGKALLQPLGGGVQAKPPALPGDEVLRAGFANLIGNMYAGQPGLETMQYEGAKAIYAALTPAQASAGTGLDGPRMRTAVYLSAYGSATPREAGLLETGASRGTPVASAQEALPGMAPLAPLEQHAATVKAQSFLAGIEGLFIRVQVGNPASYSQADVRNHDELWLQTRKQLREIGQWLAQDPARGMAMLQSAAQALLSRDGGSEAPPRDLQGAEMDAAAARQGGKQREMWETVKGLANLIKNGDPRSPDVALYIGAGLKFVLAPENRSIAPGLLLGLLAAHGAPAAAIETVLKAAEQIDPKRPAYLWQTLTGDQFTAVMGTSLFKGAKAKIGSPGQPDGPTDAPTSGVQKIIQKIDELTSGITPQVPSGQLATVGSGAGSGGAGAPPPQISAMAAGDAPKPGGTGKTGAGTGTPGQGAAGGKEAGVAPAGSSAPANAVTAPQSSVPKAGEERIPNQNIAVANGAPLFGSSETPKSNLAGPEKPVRSETNAKGRHTKTEKIYSESSEDGHSSIHAELSKDGVVEFAIDASKTGLSGRQMFRNMIEHFQASGTEIEAIRGSWTNKENTPRNKNLGAVNRLTAEGMSLENAVKKAWTAEQAAQFGFTEPAIEFVQGTPGKYTKIQVIFKKK